MSPAEQVARLREANAFTAEELAGGEERNARLAAEVNTAAGGSLSREPISV